MAKKNNSYGLKPSERRLLHKIMKGVRGANHPSDEGGKYHVPPFLSFDPAIEAERRAAQRGLRDTAQDTRIASRRTKRDLLTELKDLRTQKKRGLRDLRLGKERGLLGIDQGREDVRLRKTRGMEDFGFQLEGLSRRFTQLGNQQRQQANAQGVLGAGTQAASAAARLQNRQIAESPINTGKTRLIEDTRTSLDRLGIEQQQLLQDTKIGRRDLRQDVRHDKKLAHVETRDTLRDLHLRLQRAIREQRIGDINLIQSEIYDARNKNPGAFSKYGKGGGK